MNKVKIFDRISGILVILFVFLFWEAMSQFKLVDPIFLPPPSTIIIQFFKSIFSITVLVDSGVTIYRFLLGYILGCLLAIPLGIIMGIKRKVYSALEPLFESIRPIPASALIPLALMIFGLGDKMTIVIVAYAVVWPVLINTIDGVKSVEPILIDTGRIFGLSNKRMIRKIIIPASLPNIVTGMRISLALSIVLVIVVEMLVGDKGLGHRVIDAERTFRFAEMYGVIIMIGILGYLVNKLFLKMSNIFIEWHIKSKEGTLAYYE